MTHFAIFLMALAALLLSLISLAVSVLGRTGNVRQLSLDVAELYDRVDHWQRRDRVRKLREGQEKAATERRNGAEAPTTKQELREWIFGTGGGGAPVE